MEKSRIAMTFQLDHILMHFTDYTANKFKAFCIDKDNAPFSNRLFLFYTKIYNLS